MTKLTPPKLARLEAGLTQWDVAKETGIAQTLISLYERKMKEPSQQHKEALSKCYGRQVEDLWA